MTKTLLALVLATAAMFGQTQQPLSQQMKPGNLLNVEGWRKAAITTVLVETRQKNEGNLSDKIDDKELAAAAEAFWDRNIRDLDGTRDFAKETYQRVNGIAIGKIEWKKLLEQVDQFEMKAGAEANADGGFALLNSRAARKTGDVAVKGGCKAVNGVVSLAGVFGRKSTVRAKCD